MALITTSGFDNFLDNIKELEEEYSEIAGEMLDRGGEVAAEKWREAIKTQKHIKTGAMLNAVKKSVRKGSKVCEVYPRGKDKNGVRNAEKAYIINYGNSHRVGDRFVEKLEKECENDVYDAMAEVVDDYIEKKKGF